MARRSPDVRRMKPDFIIGGAPKCATTALFDYLAQHPQVFASNPKEPHYFASAALGHPVMQGDYSLEEYQNLFAGRAPGELAGEGSTHYLHHAAAVAPLMAAQVPNVKLIFCLREPVARAYSHFLFRYSVAGPYTLGGMGQVRNFTDFVQDTEVFRMGDYAAQLEIFYRHFDPSQIHIVFFDDMARDLKGCLQGTCRFLGIDPEHAFDLTKRSNETVYPRMPDVMPVVDRFATRAYRRLTVPQRRKLLGLRRSLMFGRGAPKPRMTQAEGNFVQSLYRDSVKQLEALTNRDLASWRRARQKP
ncbi:sulfotransferase domain-containing protein [Erythrobacter sp. NFXS35]